MAVFFLLRRYWRWNGKSTRFGAFYLEPPLLVIDGKKRFLFESGTVHHEPRSANGTKCRRENGGVLGALPLTSEFGYPNSVLATTQDSGLKVELKNSPKKK
ncbi:MAG: hypothetical protein E6Z15_26955, partial [Paenibacillus macerans]|nr:hypothetical protein [Paenibacillus macerans]